MDGAVRVPEQSRQCNPLAHKTAHPCHFKECAVLTRINPVISRSWQARHRQPATHFALREVTRAAQAR